MKKLFLIFSIFFSLNIFATGNTTMMPVSTQKVANATLTCPSGKWCKVLYAISTSVQSGSAGTAGGAGGMSSSGEFILKSSETATGTYTAVSSIACYGISTVTVSVGGIVIAKVDAGSSNANWSNPCSSSSTGQYSFYSMEYWN